MVRNSNATIHVAYLSTIFYIINLFLSTIFDKKRIYGPEISLRYGGDEQALAAEGQVTLVEAMKNAVSMIISILGQPLVETCHEIERRRTMANKNLKKHLRDIVDNQIQANDPDCTRKAFEDLQAAGYSVEMAKEKISAIVLEEIYDVLKEGQSFDVRKYREKLENMVNMSMGSGSNRFISTAWEEWDRYVQSGYECLYSLHADEALKLWDSAWPVFQMNIAQLPEKLSILQLMEEQDYEYEMDAWIQDYETELHNAGRQEDRLIFCQKILEMFDWESDNNEYYMKIGAADALFRLGRKEEAYARYDEWLKDDPQNLDMINGYCWLLEDDGQKDEAYTVIRRTIWGTSCNADNDILFDRASRLAGELGRQSDRAWYDQQIEKHQASFRRYETDLDMFGDAFTAPKKVPVVKQQKIYPNDPCPCGSGKKYKKCCGKNA